MTMGGSFPIESQINNQIILPPFGENSQLIEIFNFQIKGKLSYLE